MNIITALEAELKALEELVWETAAAKIEKEGEFLSPDESNRFLQDIINGNC